MEKGFFLEQKENQFMKEQEFCKVTKTGVDLHAFVLETCFLFFFLVNWVSNWPLKRAL